MTRVKSKAAIKHRKLLKKVKGYRGAPGVRARLAHQALLQAREYAFAGRKKRRRDLRRLWIQRINAAVRTHGLSYNKFINALGKTKLDINRKELADLAVRDPKKFAQIVDKARAAL